MPRIGGISAYWGVLAPSTEYAPRHSEETFLYRVVMAELETFLARQQEREHPVPSFVEKEFRSFLDCGVLERGFVRLRCQSCGHGRFAVDETRFPYRRPSMRKLPRPNESHRRRQSTGSHRKNSPACWAYLPRATTCVSSFPARSITHYPLQPAHSALVCPRHRSFPLNPSPAQNPVLKSAAARSPRGKS